MKLLKQSEGRGKSCKVTAEIVRQVVSACRQYQSEGKTLRIESFTKHLEQSHKIELSEKTVSEILTANDLHKVRVKNRRPKFYQSLRQKVPNGLIGIDGSDFTVTVDSEPRVFNVELCVDIPSFHHNSFSVSAEETTEEVLKVLEERREKWGSPLGIVSDCGSANLSEKTQAYLKRHDIEPTPAGPGNPKGNGTLEGAFSQMKEVVGVIELNTASPRTLAQSVLEKVISVYILMRNRQPVGTQSKPPEEIMKEPTTAEEERESKEKYRRQRERKLGSQAPDQEKKLKRLNWVIEHHNMEVDESSRKRGEKSINYYGMEAINEAEQAFVRAIGRNAMRATLPYFFGILKRIQQQKDDNRYKEYCRQRYEYKQLLEREREKLEEENDRPSVEIAVAQLCEAVTAPMKPLRDIAIKQGQRMLGELKGKYRYMGALKKKIADSLGEIRELTSAQKAEVFTVIEATLA
jgi:transposase InsO family protein